MQRGKNNKLNKLIKFGGRRVSVGDRAYMPSCTHSCLTLRGRDSLESEMNQARPQGAPSIYHTCRQRGLHNTKLEVATRKLFLPSASRRDAPTRPQVSFPSLLHTWSHFISRREKVADCSWCVSAQSWAQSGRGGIERHRETQAARRESERSGPLFLCLMRGALRGELAGMLRHASPQLSAALAARCPELIALGRWLQVRA